MKDSLLTLIIQLFQLIIGTTSLPTWLWFIIAIAIIWGLARLATGLAELVKAWRTPKD